MSPNGIRKQESRQNVNKVTKNSIRITAFWSNSNSEQQSKSSLEGSVWIQNGIQNQELDQKWEKTDGSSTKNLSVLFKLVFWSNSISEHQHGPYNCRCI